MTAKEQAFLKDLRRVMRDHKVKMEHEYLEWDSGPAVIFKGKDIHLTADEEFAQDLKDQGGNRDEV